MWAVQHPGSWTKRCDPTDTGPEREQPQPGHLPRDERDRRAGFVQVTATDVTMTPACNPSPCPVPGGTVTVTVRGTFKLIMGGFTFPLAATATGNGPAEPDIGSTTAEDPDHHLRTIAKQGDGRATDHCRRDRQLRPCRDLHELRRRRSAPRLARTARRSRSLPSGRARSARIRRATRNGKRLPPVSQSFDIDPPPPPGPQTITFAPLPNQMLGTPPITVTATASSGLTVTFSTTTPSGLHLERHQRRHDHLIAVGTCSVLADQAGNAQFTPAPTVQRDFTVTPLVCNPPVAAFTVTPTSGNAANNGGKNGTLFTFNSNATTNMTFAACNPTWSWNFGDSTGTSSVAEPDVHVHERQQQHDPTGDARGVESRRPEQHLPRHRAELTMTNSVATTADRPWSNSALPWCIFLLLLFGVVDLGRGIYQFNGVSQAAREIARVTSVHRGTACPPTCTSPETRGGHRRAKSD